MGARNGEESNIEEERRLMYVAVTRAKEVLFLSYARHRIKYGEEQISIRSRFLDEVDAGVVVNERGASIQQRKSMERSTPQSGKSNDYVIDRSTSQDFDYDWKTPKKSRSSSSSYRIVPDEQFSEDPNQFVTGAQVLHPKFGPGKIINRSGEASEVKVTVFFPKTGQKKLLLKFAKLKLL
jgi:DNA helicase-2/ATP-dependent DNA helicase PcrA